ncbi:MAG: VWA domain-containing protein [Saprospiraceae bacterium]
MFRFEQEIHLYALAILPVLLVFFVIAWQARKRALQRFGNNSLLVQLMPRVSKYKHGVKFALLMVAMAFLIVGWANPQWGTKKEKVKRKSADIFVALDISRSMLAEDVRPNRMERAKVFAQKLIKGLKGERIGTIIFAGNAYLQMPLTTDYSAAQLFTKSANPSMAPSQGTAIVDAIDLAERSFADDAQHHKALVIITDGENHDQEALERAEEAHENGLLIFTVGVGTAEGELMPTVVNGRRDYIRDQSGSPVRSKLNSEMLRDLASAGDGVYFNLNENSDVVITALKESIDRLEKKEMEQRIFNEYESYFQYFIAAALLFLLVEFMTSYRQNKLLEGKDLFS